MPLRAISSEWIASVSFPPSTSRAPKVMSVRVIRIYGDECAQFLECLFIFPLADIDLGQGEMSIRKIRITLQGNVKEIFGFRKTPSVIIDASHQIGHLRGVYRRREQFLKIGFALSGCLA